MTVKVSVAVQVVTRLSQADEGIQGVQTAVGGAIVIVDAKGRGVADENVNGAAIAQTTPQKGGQQAQGTEVGFCLGVLIDASGVVADASAQAGNSRALDGYQPQVHVGAAFGARHRVTFIVLRIMVAGDVAEGNVQNGNKIFEIGIGQVAAPQNEINIFELSTGGEAVEAIYHLVTDSKDFHKEILPQKCSICKGRTCGVVANTDTAHYNLQHSQRRSMNLDTQNVTQPVDNEGTPARRQLQSGTLLFNRYHIQEVIGVGGMGSVYRARDMHFPNVVKLVAVKEMVNMAPDPLVRQTIVQNFEREANLLATLSHPSIPRIYDYFTQDDRSYLVLEFIHGKDLEAIISETDGFLPEDQVLSWAIQLCDVLDFLHKHKPDPIIFRDMKPSNIMINNNGDVILVDFGIAKTFQVGQKGTMIGTEGYSPPEQYRGEATPLADIYALGATLHHALTRRDPRLEPPFSFNERPIRRINPNVSVEMEAVVNTALKYNPSERFPSAAAMKEALMGVARKTGALSKITAALPAQVNTVKPLWTFKCEDEIRGTPTLYQGMLFIGCYDNNLYALNAADGKFQWKYPTDGGIVSRPAVYDGNIYFGSEDKRLHVISARSGKVLWTYYTEGKIHSSPRIAEGHVFIGADDHMLHAVNLTTGRASWKFEVADEIHSTPFVFNDLVYVGSEGGDFYAIEFRGEMKWRFQAKRAITSSPIVVGQAVYFASLDGTLYALDARNGWILWRFRLGKGSISSPAMADDLVFIGATDGFLYCVDSRTAKEVWRFRTDHQVNGSPVVYKDSVYFGSVDGNIYCLEYRTGRLRWKFATGGPITGSPLVFDDIVYIGSTDHQVYALFA